MDQYELNPMLTKLMGLRNSESKAKAEEEKTSPPIEHQPIKDEPIERHASHEQPHYDSPKIQKNYSDNAYKKKKERFEKNKYQKKHVVYVPVQKGKQEGHQEPIKEEAPKVEIKQEIEKKQENLKEEKPKQEKPKEEKPKEEKPIEEEKKENRREDKKYYKDHKNKPRRQKGGRYGYEKKEYKEWNDNRPIPKEMEKIERFNSDNSKSREWQDKRGENTKDDVKEDFEKPSYGRGRRRSGRNRRESHRRTTRQYDEVYGNNEYNKEGGYKKGKEGERKEYQDRGKRKYNNKGRYSKNEKEYSQEDIAKGLENGTMMQGEYIKMFRYNQHSYIKVVGLHKDILIKKEDQAKSAMSGDTVVVLISPLVSWKRIETEDIVNENVEEVVNEKEVIQKIDKEEKEKVIENVEAEADVPVVEKKEEPIESAKQKRKDRYKKDDVKDAKEEEELNKHQEVYQMLSTAAEKLDYIKKHLLKYQIAAVVIKVLNQVEMKSEQLCTLFSTSSEFSIKMSLYALPANRQLPVMKIMPIPNQYIVDLIKKNNPHLKYYMCKYTQWPSEFHIPNGKVVRSLGNSGQIEIETERIMRQFKMYNNMKDHSKESIEYAEKNKIKKDQNGNVIITPEEASYRMDLRDRRVFTVDPETCRDVDDAVHIKKINDNKFEIGIHIADVSHYIEEGCVLDKEAMERSTSVYFPHKVYTMLPRLLTEDLCSLNQGVDRYCFSVVANINKDGEVIMPYEENVKYGKGIIRSRAKWFYELVQDLVDGKVNSENIPKDKVPVGCTLDELVDDAKLLYGLTLKRRAERLKNGMFTLEKKQFTFHLDPITNIPNDFIEQKRIGTKYMIEELMLLANRLVAEKIHSCMSTNTILRVHRDFEQKERIEKKVAALGLKISMKTQKSIYDSLEAIKAQSDTLYFCVLQRLLVSLKPAEYIISEHGEPNELCHYALNFPLYSHFTSPIRRYPDIIAHRLLEASIKYGKDALSHCKVDYRQAVSKCSANYKNGKKAGDYASKLFIALYFEHKYINKEKEKFTGYIIDMQESNIMIYVKEIDIIHKIVLSERKGEIQSYDYDEDNATMELNMYAPDEKVVKKQVKMFETISVIVSIQEKLPLELKVSIAL